MERIWLAACSANPGALPSAADMFAMAKGDGPGAAHRVFDWLGLGPRPAVALCHLIGVAPQELWIRTLAGVPAAMVEARLGTLKCIKEETAPDAELGESDMRAITIGESGMILDSLRIAKVIVITPEPEPELPIQEPAPATPRAPPEQSKKEPEQALPILDANQRAEEVQELEDISDSISEAPTLASVSDSESDDERSKKRKKKHKRTKKDKKRRKDDKGKKKKRSKSRARRAGKSRVRSPRRSRSYRGSRSHSRYGHGDPGFRLIIDQSLRGMTFPRLPREEIEAARLFFVKENRGKEPEKGQIGTANQLSGLADLFGRDENPYGDPSVFRPFGNAFLEDTQMTSQDKLRQARLAGPQGHEDWQKFWAVFSMCIIGLRIARWNTMEDYGTKIRKLIETWPKSWKIILRADRMMRREVVLRYIAEQRQKDSSQLRDPFFRRGDASFDFALRAAVLDKDFWEEEVRLPTDQVAQGLKTEADLADPGYGTVRTEAVPAIAGLTKDPVDRAAAAGAAVPPPALTDGGPARKRRRRGWGSAYSDAWAAQQPSWGGGGGGKGGKKGGKGGKQGDGRAQGGGQDSSGGKGGGCKDGKGTKGKQDGKDGKGKKKGYTNKPCWDWQNGYCARGTSCLFSHS